MRHLLVINPNTGQATTQRLHTWIKPLLPSDVQLDCITARFGAPYSACEASHAVAGHALLDAWANHLHTSQRLPDGVLIACFGDPGIFALRASSAAPVSGLAEASFIQASALGAFAIVTGGVHWPAMLRRLALGLGYAEQIKAIEIVQETGAQMLADKDMALRVLAKACQRAVESGAKSIILGGAGLAGYAQDLQASVPVPLIDSVSAALSLYLDQRLPPAQQTVNAFESAWHNLPDHMRLAG
jgi:Asp/Glu/hydantoin racemase